MIGNDLHTDIAGAKAIGLDTLYMHTNLTPPDQREADPLFHPSVATDTHNYEYEGADWQELTKLIETI